MATKKAKQKAEPKQVVTRVSKPAQKAVKRPAAKAKTVVKAVPQKTQKVAKPAAKRVVAPNVTKAPPAKVVAAKPVAKLPVKDPAPKVRSKPEPPPMDHNAVIGPLYLGAGHGHLARPVDKTWIEALERYRKAIDDAIAYEAKRTPIARATMVLSFARQVQTLMNNLAARLSAIAAEVSMNGNETTHTSGKLLVVELKRLNDTYGAMAGPEGIAPLGEEGLSTGLAPQLDLLQRAYFNNIARWADLERALN